MSQKNSQGDVGISSSAVLQHCVSALLQDIEMSKTFIYAPSPSLHVSLYSSVFDVLGCCDAAEVFRFFKNTLSDHLKHQVQRLALMYQYNSDLFHVSILLCKKCLLFVCSTCLLFGAIISS